MTSPSTHSTDIAFGARQTTVTRTIAKGGTSLVAGRVVVLATQVSAGLVLARLLSPSDFGMVAMVTTVMNFALIFRDMGLSYATVQDSKLDEQQLSNLFWINISAGALGTLLLIASIPLVRWYYGVEQLGIIVGILAVAFFLNAASVQHAALLRRRFAFVSLAIADIISVLASTLAAIVLALHDGGIKALLLQQILRPAIFLMCVLVSAKWKPLPPRRSVGTKRQVRFGTEILTFDIINYFAQNIDKLLIGRVFGASVLGHFSRAHDLVLLPITQLRAPIASAAVPALAASRSDKKQYEQGFLFVTKTTSLFAVPFLTLLTLEAPVTVPIVLGAQWTPAIPFFQVLALAGIPRIIIGSLGTHLIAAGQSKRYMRWGMWHGAVISLGVIATLPFGATAVAMSLLLTHAAVFIPSAIYVLNDDTVRLRAFLAVSATPITFGATAALGILAVRWATNGVSATKPFLEISAFTLVYSLQLLYDKSLRTFLRSQLLRNQCDKLDARA